MYVYVYILYVIFICMYVCMYVYICVYIYKQMPFDCSIRDLTSILAILPLPSWEAL